MKARTLLLAAVILVMGTLQVWDSAVFRAPAVIVALALAAVVIPAASMLASNPAIRFAAIISSALLLLAARIASPLTHNTLHLVTFIAALCMFADWRLSNRALPAGDHHD